MKLLYFFITLPFSLKKISSSQFLTRLDTMEENLLNKLSNMEKTYNALDERLSYPDVALNPDLLLTLSKEKSAISKTVDYFRNWKSYENECLSLIEMDKTLDSSDSMKDIIKEEISDIKNKQKTLVENIYE